MTDRAPVPEGRASFQRANDESRERMARLFATLTPAQMAIDRSFVARNAASRQRLIATVGRLRATDLQLPTAAGGWTVPGSGPPRVLGPLPGGPLASRPGRWTRTAADLPAGRTSRPAQ
jgi:hypothetical protein